MPMRQTKRIMPSGQRRHTSSIDTLTLYIGPQRSAPMIDDILRLAPKRVIFNPGTESKELAAALNQANIPHWEACTLVMLQTGQF
jgi:hypothetical protein